MHICTHARARAFIIIKLINHTDTHTPGRHSTDQLHYEALQSAGSQTLRVLYEKTSFFAVRLHVVPCARLPAVVVDLRNAHAKAIKGRQMH